MKSGVLYFLSNDHLSMEEKIRHLVPFYIQKTERIPECVEVNPEQIGDLREMEFPVIGLPDWVKVRVVADKATMRNHFLIGVEENE